MTQLGLLLRTPRRLVDADADAMPPHLDMASFGKRSTRRSTVFQTLLVGGLVAVVLVILLTAHYTPFRHPHPPAVDRATQLSFPSDDLILTSYSYFEKDSVQLANFQFFMSVGMGVSSTYKSPSNTDFVIVVNGPQCTPCKSLSHALTEDQPAAAVLPTVSQAWSGKGLLMLQRRENEGMDFAAHNVTIEYLRKKNQYKRYKYFIFLNSSVRGPFYPSYMPMGWQWTMAYTQRFKGDVKLVSSSIVCLPKVDAGGYGPKVESWAFAIDQEGLDLVLDAGVFYLRTCKLCDDGVVVLGEYGLSNTLLNKGFNIATLMSRYNPDTDWREERHWHCNSNVHPSRHGTYDSISMHPFETVFLKASWHVGEPHLSRYTSWFLGMAAGSDNTGGTFNEPLYRYAITLHAQDPNNAADCFKVGGTTLDQIA